MTDLNLPARMGGEPTEFPWLDQKKTIGFLTGARDLFFNADQYLKWFRLDINIRFLMHRIMFLGTLKYYHIQPPDIREIPFIEDLEDPANPAEKKPTEP